VVTAPGPSVPHPQLLHHKPGAPRSKAGPDVCTKRSPFQGTRTGWGTKGGPGLLEFSRRGSFQDDTRNRLGTHSLGPC